MLEKMKVGLQPINVPAAWAKENEVQDWELAGIYYLKNGGSVEHTKGSDTTQEH